MKMKSSKKFWAVLILLAAGIAFWAGARAEVQYPVAELGGCTNKDECKKYCDNQENIKVCLDFAKKNGMMSPDEIKKAEVFVALGNKGPGGCDSKESCDAFCENPQNIRECVTFAKQNGLISGNELQEAEKVLAAIEKGITPPPCKGKKECDIYCEDAAHMEECINFAIKAGFMEGNEIAEAQKMLAAIKKGAVPPKCRGKEECDVYCQQDSHFEECMAFAEKAGFMTAEDAAMARKTKGKGPGGCRGKEECDAFCQNPANQETCFNFGKEFGLIPAEELQKMEEGKKQMQQGVMQAPPEVINCLQEKLGAEAVDKIKNGTFMPSQSSGDAMRQCFEKMMPMMVPQGGPSGGPVPPAGMIPAGSQPTQMNPTNFQGPGGCKSEEECKNYCQSNPSACQNFMPPMPPQGTQMQMPPNQMMPPINMDPSMMSGQIPMPQNIPNQMPMPDGQMIPPSPRPQPSMPGAMPPPAPEGQPQPMPAPEAPAQPPPPTSFNPLSLLGAVVQAFLNLFR